MDPTRTDNTVAGDSGGEAVGAVAQTVASARRGKSRLRRMKAAERRQVVMKALIPILAVALIVLLRRPLGGPAHVVAEIVEADPTETVLPDVVKLAWEVPAVYEHAGRDPMEMSPVYLAVGDTPAEATPSAIESLEVVGLLQSEDRPAAIIGTRIVHEGDAIGDTVVTAIDREGVEFQRDDRRWRQTVGSQAILPGEGT